MWNKSEPVRSYVYSVLAVLLGLLVAKGVIHNTELDLWLALAGTVLAVPSVELARKRVQPLSKQGDGGQYPE